jgi:hypothetical protein
MYNYISILCSHSCENENEDVLGICMVYFVKFVNYDVSVFCESRIYKQSG